MDETLEPGTRVKIVSYGAYGAGRWMVYKTGTVESKARLRYRIRLDEPEELVTRHAGAPSSRRVATHVEVGERVLKVI